jgi:hypothetical protein
MWFPGKASDILKIALESVNELRTSNAALAAELAATKSELASAKINADWLRIKVNDLEAMNKALLERAYSIKLPVPEIVQKPSNLPEIFSQAMFEHISEDAPYGA